MNNMEIKKYPESVLKKRAKEITEPLDGLYDLSQEMTELMKETNGIGLAGPQVGLSKRIIIVETERGPQTLINPQIITKSKETEAMEEGCLSMPGVYLNIKRSKEVLVRAINLEGKEVEIRAKGLLARIFQHEIDHLNGILIINRVPFWKRWKINVFNQ